jgi:RimJ/RimL family protein N-acetyltransferase
MEKTKIVYAEPEAYFPKEALEAAEQNALFETDRLLLRKITQADFDDWFAFLSDAETMKHYPAPYDAAGVQRWMDWTLNNYEKYGFGLWAVILKENGRFIGDCGITMQNIHGQQLPEIGYHIHHPYWRQGYGKEAAAAVRDWFFRNTQFDTLYSYMTTANIPSRSTAASVGMTHIKQYTDANGDELCVYALTREAWARMQKY